MSDFVNRLREINVDEDSFVTLKYTEGNDVWHINDGYVTDSVYERVATFLTRYAPKASLTIMSAERNTFRITSPSVLQRPFMTVSIL